MEKKEEYSIDVRIDFKMGCHINGAILQPNPCNKEKAKFVPVQSKAKDTDSFIYSILNNEQKFIILLERTTYKIMFVNKDSIQYISKYTD